MSQLIVQMGQPRMQPGVDRINEPSDTTSPGVAAGLARRCSFDGVTFRQVPD